MGIVYNALVNATKYILLILACLCFSPALLAIEDGKLKTPQTEAEEVIAHLADKKNFSESDRVYIKYLTTYNLPENLREDAVLVASFILHSVSGLPSSDINIDDNRASGFNPLAIRGQNTKTFIGRQQVPGSNTLWYFDLRDFNLTPQAWEKAALLDGYFAEPIIKPDTSGALRLLGGNSLLRMDWFINHVIDSTRQSDIDAEIQSLYNEFVFCNVGVPKTADEWWYFLGLNRARARKNGNASYALITTGITVARHNRILEEYRTENGYGYETYDVKNLQGFRDYVESFFKNKDIGGPPDISDAGEMFASNPLGLDVYGLRDANFKLINFGDPTVVRHINDMLGDNRVRNAFSCFDCHAAGPIPPENTLRDFIRSDGKLYLKNKRDENKVRRTYLSGRFEDNTLDNQAYFAKKLFRTNGLTPEENAKAFNRIILYYNNPIDINRGALECGVTLDEFKLAIAKDKFGNRLKLLLSNNIPIPIEAWESRGKDGIPGSFQQAMIKIYGLTKITETTEVGLTPIQYEVLANSEIKAGVKVVGQIKAGEKISYDSAPRIENGWMAYGQGWIQLKNVRLLSK